MNKPAKNTSPTPEQYWATLHAAGAERLSRESGLPVDTQFYSEQAALFGPALPPPGLLASAMLGKVETLL